MECTIGVTFISYGETAFTVATVPAVRTECVRAE